MFITVCVVKRERKKLHCYGKVPQVGQLEISVEEGMIQQLSRRVVADASVVGCKLLDATLTEDAATSLLVTQAYALISAHLLVPRAPGIVKQEVCVV